MDNRIACCAIIFAMVCISSASGEIEIPDKLKTGKMRKYPACMSLFNQSTMPYAIDVEEVEGGFKKVCNCSYHSDPPKSGLRIACHYAKEAVILIPRESYQHLSEILYFLLRYRIRGTTNPWLEKRIEYTRNPLGKIDLDRGQGNPNVYEVQIYVVSSDGTRRLIFTDAIQSITGQSVTPKSNANRYPTSQETEYTQYEQSFSMTFDLITDTSMKITFTTKSPDVFKVEYINNGQTLLVPLDPEGHATLTGLTADTDYVFIVSYYNENGEWREMRRKTVRTMAGGRFYGGSHEPSFIPGGSDVTLECPVVQDVGIQSVSWYKGADRNNAQLIATYDTQSGETTYSGDRDPRIEVINYGLTLKIKGRSPEYAGHYRCRYSILGSGNPWNTGVIPGIVTLYITWQTRPGIVAYYIQYRPYGTTGRWETITLRDAQQPRTIVQDLTPVTKYEFEVYDFTNGIQGDLLDTLIETTGRSDEVEIGPEPVLPDDGCEGYRCGRGECDPYPTPHCVCDSGFTGESCDVAINYCDSNPCLYGGICNALPSGYVCQCRRGYSGTNCERERTACNPNPCQNSGVCVSLRDGLSYSCRCRRGYSGPRCQTRDRLPCDSRPCVYGTCSVLGRNYHCDCDRGYEGRNCDTTDGDPSILLKCPIQEEHGRPEMIQWVRNQDRERKQIYVYDVVNNRRTEGSVYEYRGRLYSPTLDSLIIRDSQSRDVGTYECVVSYPDTIVQPSPMRLVKVPLDDTRVTVSWRPNRMYIDHYDVKHRDVASDDDFITVQIPRGSNQYTFTNMEPGGVYEISVTPFTKPGEVNRNIEFDILESSFTTTTVATTTTPPPPPSRADKQYDELIVTVFGSAEPVSIGSTTYLHCNYRDVGNTEPTVAWKKITGGSARYIYNQKMPPTPSRNKISMTNEHQLRIKNFQSSDAGTYECIVTYDTPLSRTSGSGKVQLEAAEPRNLPPPTNFRHVVNGPTTAVLSWQAPRSGVVTGYIIRYYPTTRRFGEYETREVSTTQIALDELIEGGEYNVEIRASNGRQFSEPLEGVFDQVTEKIPAPINFSVQMLSKTQAQISWEQPDTRGITGYRIKYWDISRPAEDNLVTRQTRLNSFVLPDLIDDAQYQVWIQAMKGDSISPQLVGQFRKTTPEAPNPPSTIKFKNIESDSVTAYWDAPDGWKATDKYRVVVISLNNSFPHAKTYPDSAPNMIVINHLRPGIRYRVTVYTVRNGRPSVPVYRNLRTVEILDLTLPFPDVVTLKCVLRMSDSPLLVRWYKIDSEGKEQLIFTSSSDRSYPNENMKQFLGRLSSPSITELSISNIRHPEDFGKYKCSARSRTNTGSHILELVGKYPVSIAPPYRFLYDFTSDSTARVTWEHPYPDEITSYVVRYWPTIRRFGPEKTLETTERKANLTELIAGTEYQVEIKSRINRKISDDSLVGQLINFAKHVKNIKIERLPNGELKISWENPEDIDGTQLSIRPAEISSWNDQPPVSKDVTSRRIRYPMEPGEKVYFKITTLKNNIQTPTVVEYTERDVVNVERIEKEPEVSVPENVPGSVPNQYPKPVSNLQLESLSPSSLSARWEPTPDVNFDYYSIVLTNIRTREYENFNMSKSYIEIYGLSPYQTYEVKVSTVRDGKSSFPTVDSLTLGPQEQLPPEAIPDDADETESEPLDRNTIPSLVPQPTNLRFSNVMRSRFTVEWDSPNDEITDFEISYRPKENDEQEWFKVTANGYTSVTLRGLTQDTIYDVIVVSKLEHGEKSYPLTGEQRTQRGTQRRVILRKPIVEVIEKTSNSFRLRWTEQDAEHRVIVTPIGGVGQRQTINVPRGENTLHVTELEPGKRHRTTVTPLSGGRKGKPAVIYTTTNPNSPTELQVTELGFDRVILAWREPASTLITGYNVTYYPVATNIVTNIQTRTNKINITGLEPETDYVIVVRTKQGHESSAPISIPVTTKREPLSAPSNAVTSVSGNDFIIRWSPVPDAETYEVSYFPEDDQSRSVKQRVDSPTTLIRIPNIYPGNYIVKVSAVKEDQLSPTRDSQISMPAKAPRYLRLGDVTNDGLTATWEAPTNVIYSPQYDVIAQPNSGRRPLRPQPLRTDKTSYTFEGLRPNTEYTIQVMSRYRDQRSEPITATISTAPLQRPSNVQSTVRNGVIRVNWSPVDGADSYEVSYNPVGEDDRVVTVNLPAETTYYDVPTSTPAEYEVKVVAVKDDQKSPFTSVRRRLGVDKPISVSFSDITEDTIVVEWVPPRTRQRLTYKVRLTNPDDVTQAPIERDTGNNWYLFTELQPATRYLAEVVAVFGDQESEPTSNVVTTGVPLIRRVTAPVTDGNQPVKVLWREVPQADSYIVTYYPVGGIPQVINVKGDQNGVVLNNLEPDTEYVVTVSTVINRIKGEPNEISLTTGPVATPQNIETAPSSDSVRVSWTPVDNIDEYEVTYYPVGESHNAVRKIVTSPYYDITGVEPGQYEVTVTAIKSGHRSPKTSVQQNIGVKPPTEIQFTDVTDTGFVVIWTPSLSPNVISYEVRVTSPDELSQEPMVTETASNYVPLRDLPSGTNYIVEVFANTDFQQSVPLIGEVSTVVPAPSRITPTLPEEDGTVEITWGHIPNVEHYEVSYYPVGGEPEILIIPGDHTRTVIRDLLPGTDYVIEVTSMINEVRSTPTTIKITTPLETPKETIVQPLTGDSTPGQSSVRVTWDDDGSAPEYEVTYYSVERIGDEVIRGEPQVIRVPSRDRGVVLNNLRPATEYIVEVKALNGPKTSRPGKITITTPLDQPERVQIQEPGEEDVTITWQRPQGDVTEYVVEIVPTDGSDVITIPVNPRETYTTVTGLKPETEYEVRVRAINREKDIESAPVIGKIVTKPAEVRPNNVRFIPENNGSYTFTWQRPDRPVQYYRINWIKESGTPLEDSLEVSSDQNEVTLPQLEPDSEYTIVIQSVTNPSEEPDDYNSVTTKIVTDIPSLPDHITAPDVTDNSVVVQWEVPAQETFLTGYRVEVYPEDSDTPLTAVDIPRTKNSASLMGLSPDTTYTIKVTPHINRKPGKPATYTLRTDELRTVPPPESVNIPETTSEDVVVQWYAPQNHEYITKYNIEVVDEDGNTIVNKDLSPDTYTYTITDLKPGASYDVFVRSFVNDRKSEPAPEVATTLPRQPHEVTITNPLPNQFEISWAPSDGDVISYLVNVIPQNNPRAQELFFETERPSILIPDVQPDTEYVVQVITVGPGHLESNPTTIRVTTPSEPEDRTPETEVKPEGTVTFVPEQPEIMVTWQKLPDQPIESYQVLYRIPGNDKTNIVTVPSETGEIVLSSLEPRGVYDVWVRGLLDNGKMIPIDITDHRFVDVLSPESYAPLTGNPVPVPEDGKIQIVWDNLGPDVTQYGITYRTPNSEEEQQVVVPGTYSGTVLSGLTPGDEYVISVIGMRNGELPVVVEHVNIGTTDDIPKKSTEAIGSTPTGQVTIQWTTDIDDDRYNDVIGYKIIFDKECCRGEPDIAWVPGKDTDAATIPMLEPDTEYIFSVEATTSDGRSFPVNDVRIVNEIEFPDTIVTYNLNPPIMGRVEGRKNSATVFWQPPREEGRLPITHYIVSYIPFDKDYVPTFRVLVPESDNSHTVTGLAPNTNYNIEVQSTNLPSKAVSLPVRIQYLTPFEDENDYVEPTPPDLMPDEDRTVEHVPTRPGETSSTQRPPISIVTKPYPSPDAITTTGFPEPLENDKRSSTTKPNQPITLPIRPVTRPIRPVTRPVRPVTRPVRPVTRPIQPVTRPVRPVTRPIQPVIRPTRPVTRPIQPVTRPVRPVTRPIQPVTRPTRPVTRPVERPNKSTTADVPIPFDESEFYTSDNGQITVSWRPFFDEDDSGTYKVVFTNPEKPDDVKEVVVPNYSQLVTMTDLEPDTPYNVEVEATSDNYDVFFLPASKVTENKLPKTLHPYQFLLKPRIVSIEPYDEDATIVHWVNPLKNQRRQPTHYILQFKPKYAPDSSQSVRVEVPADKTSHVVTGLQPGLDYIVTLQSANKPTKTRSNTEIIEYTIGKGFEPETTTRWNRPSRTRPIIPTRTTSTIPRTRPTIPSWTEPTLSSSISPTDATEPLISEATTTPSIPGESTTERRPNVVTPSLLTPISTTTPELIEEPAEPNEGDGLQATTPQPTVVVPEEEKAGVDALPTFDGNVIINWTPATSPVDNYVVKWVPTDESSPIRQVTLPGDTSWINLPAPTEVPGYAITIYTVNAGQRPEPIYDIKLSQSPNSNGFKLTYKPSDKDDQPSTVTRTVTTQEVFIPGSRKDVELPETDYTLVPDEEYINWLRPITVPARRVGRPNQITLRWNPDQNITTTRATRYRLELLPINNPRARPISTLVPSNAPHNIRGLEPGVSYRLVARYIQNEGEHKRGDVAQTFVIPAFTRYGIPETTYGINEVWVKELRSGELLLQWDDFPGATDYTIEYQETPGGQIYQSRHTPDERWIVLPRLQPGHLYTIKIYATVNRVSTQIYTVTVRRKIPSLSPPSKVTWYNMLGNSVDLSWIPPQQHVTGYRIIYRLNTTDESAREYVVNLPADVTTYTMRDLIPGETYKITIQSIREEEISRPLSFHLKMLIPTVRRIYFQQTTPQVIVIKWPEMPSFVTGYLVHVKQIEPPGEDLVPETVLPPGQYNFTITNVKPGITYEFTIRTMVGNELSEPITLHLWTLRSESELSRVEHGQTGTWTVSWTRGPYQVDHWKIEVKRFGSNEVVFSEDNISRYRTSYQLRNLVPGVEYIIYIYGVRGNLSSTPIQIRIPANPKTIIANRQRENTYAYGPQLVRRFLIRRRPDQIIMELIPITTVERYIIKYKKSTESKFSTRGVDIAYDDDKATATIRYLDEGTAYNIEVTAIKDDQRSEMTLNVETPIRNIIIPLSPLENIQRSFDNTPGADGFYITWNKPPVPVKHYTVTYSYTERDGSETMEVTEPSIYVPYISDGHKANYVISYTTPDGRTSPKSIMNVSYGKTNSRPNILGLQSMYEDYANEELP